MILYIVKPIFHRHETTKKAIQLTEMNSQSYNTLKKLLIDRLKKSYSKKCCRNFLSTYIETYAIEIFLPKLVKSLM